MSDFKSRYKQAADGLEPDGRLLESLKADMKAQLTAKPKAELSAADETPAAPAKPNFFVKYGWAFGSAAACLVVALAVGVMLSVGSREMASGGAMMNEAAYDGDAAEMVEGATYGMNGASNADDFADGANGGDVYDEAAGIMPEPEEADNSYIVSTDRTEAAGDAADNAVDDMRTPEEAFSDVQNDLPMPYIEPQQVGRLKPLSYDELKTLVMIDHSGSGLILSDFALYDYIEVLEYNVYYLVMRYDNYGFIFPVVAAFQWVTPSDPIISLRLYTDYDDPYAYTDLRELSVEELEVLFSPSEYTYNFGDGDLYFGDKDIDQLTSLSDEQLFELANKAGEGTLALRDFHELELFDVGFSRYTYTFVCSYRYSVNGQGYALIAHFPDTGYYTAPNQLILRRRGSLKELDLLNDYDRLDWFLAG